MCKNNSINVTTYFHIKLSSDLIKTHLAEVVQAWQKRFRLSKSVTVIKYSNAYSINMTQYNPFWKNKVKLDDFKNLACENSLPVFIFYI